MALERALTRLLVTHLEAALPGCSASRKRGQCCPVVVMSMELWIQTLALPVNPHSAENRFLSFPPPPKLNYSRPWVFAERLVLGSLQIPKCLDLQVLFIKWHRTMHTGGSSYSPFNPWLVESMVAKPGHTQGRLYIEKEKPCVGRLQAVQNHVV